jgi:hypothetical protein
MKKEMNAQSEGKNCSGQSRKNEPRQASEATENDEMGLVPTPRDLRQEPDNTLSSS